jgi:hypothetical protein
MRALCLAMAAMLLLVGCENMGSSVPAPQYVGPSSNFEAPAGGTTFYVNGLHGSNGNDCKSPQKALQNHSTRRVHQRVGRHD